MPSINNLDLTITPAQDPTKQTVNVKGNLLFTPDEIGRSFRLSINLFAVDGGTDYGGTNDPPITIGPPKPLYTFHFGSNLINSRPYRTITVTNIDENLDETSIVLKTILDEDQGGTLHPGGIILPHKDEIKAEVSLAVVAVSDVAEIGIFD